MFQRQLFLLLIVALACAARAQEPDACLRRTVPVTVIDRDGNLVPDLIAKNFRARMGGKPVQVLSAARFQGKGRLLILLDSSGSMLEPEGKWAMARTIARQFVEKAPEIWQVALAHHSTKIREFVAFDQGRKAILAKLGELHDAKELRGKKPPRTALADALAEALELMRPMRLGDTIVAITDATSHEDRTSDREVRRLLTGSGVRLFSVFLRSLELEYERGGGRPRYDKMRFPLWEQDGVLRFEEIAKSTGGSTFSLIPTIFGRYDLTDANSPGYGADNRFPPQVWLDRLRQQATVSYEVQIVLPELISEPAKWKLEVLDPSSGKAKRDVFALYPDRLAPCAASTGAEERP